MAFTTWAAYLTQLKDILSDASARGFLTLDQFGSVGPDGVPATYRSLDELKRWINFVEAKVVAENASTSGRGRVLFCAGVR
ncbi:hypothetical protein K0U83_03315 [bacterium]|nr:hypothetical protein [bacterium]